MFYEERRCEHGNWWWRDTPDGPWYKFTQDRLLAKLNDTYDELQNMKRIYADDPPAH